MKTSVEFNVHAVKPFSMLKLQLLETDYCHKVYLILWIALLWLDLLARAPLLHNVSNLTWEWGHWHKLLVWSGSHSPSSCNMNRIWPTLHQVHPTTSVLSPIISWHWDVNEVTVLLHVQICWPICSDTELVIACINYLSLFLCLAIIRNVSY